jgi:hypothetical protein
MGFSSKEEYNRDRRMCTGGLTMKKIKLVMDRPFPTNVGISIMDVTDGQERRRGGLTAEYARIDLKPVLDRGGSLEDAMEDYDNWLRGALRRYLLDECEIVEGREELMQIIRERIEKYFD